MRYTLVSGNDRFAVGGSLPVWDSVYRGYRTEVGLISAAWPQVYTIEASPDPVVRVTLIDKLSFELLFTTLERVAVAARRKVDPLVEEAFRILEKPDLKNVDLADPETIANVQYLALPYPQDDVSGEPRPDLPAILTHERAARILAGLRPE